MKAVRFLKRNSSTILSCIGAIGVVATTITAIRETPKALTILDNAEAEKGEPLTKLEIIEKAGPIYIPSVVIGVSTIACILGASVLNRHQQAVLTSAYALVSNSYKEYKDKVKELFGEEESTRVITELAKDKYTDCNLPVSDNKILFFEELSGRYFESTMEDVQSAEYHFNRNFTLRGYAELNEFYKFLGLPEIELGQLLGWSMEAGNEYYGYSWVDFEHQLVTMDDGLECYIISYPFPPTEDYQDFW